MQRRLLPLVLVLWFAGCLRPGAAPVPAPGSLSGAPQHVLLDFEKPDAAVVWIAATDSATASATEASTQPNALQRSSLRPHAGLWSMAMVVDAPGQFRYAPGKPLDLGAFDLLTAQVAQEGAPERNGECRASLRLTDAAGHSVEGDAYPVLATWRPVPFDLRQALAHDLDVARIAAIDLVIKPGGERTPMRIKTDTWATESDMRAYVGSSTGAARSFFVESRGSRIHVGSVGQYELLISDQGCVAASMPWLQVFAAVSAGAPVREVLGTPYTGLVLLDQDALDRGPARHTTADDAPTETVTGRSFKDAGNWSWPASAGRGLSTLHWQVTWASPVAALIEGKQETGPFDRLGEPLVTANWRLMVYQGGQVFVDVRWRQTGEAAVPFGRPVSWALLTADKPSGAVAGDSPERLLNEIYPATFREGLPTALPHRMQSHGAVAMIAPALRQKDNFWWARDAVPETRWVFGAGIFTAASATSGEATCMLLVNAPSGLGMAGAFGQYLAPAKIVVKQGELGRNFPGDADNDGFVETYGFQVIRLANGRAVFTIYPQERPIFYPPILFTVPVAEREALDFKHSQFLINIEGKQFTHPPQFPDGSFLLQIPYVLDRPVTVEAVLVK